MAKITVLMFVAEFFFGYESYLYTIVTNSEKPLSTHDNTDTENEGT